MPYSSIKDVPSNVPEGKRKQFLEVFNSVYSDTKDEGKAMAAAYSTIKKNLLKAQYAADIFTTATEAISRSMDLGLNGDIHVSDYGEQAVYMPGASEDDYLNYYRDLANLPPEYDGEEEAAMVSDGQDVDRLEALRVIVREVIGKKMNEAKKEHTHYGKILKTDEEQRMIYGWASVSSYKGELIVDKQGDIIEMDTLEKAVNNFMEHVRVGKTMHVGEQTGVIIHSFPVSKSICEALGIQTDTEGWIVGYKVYDDATWEGVKSGKYASFSIGGRAIKEEQNA